MAGLRTPSRDDAHGQDREPRFRLDPKKAGARDFVLPGNKDYVPGDQIKKPPQGEAGRGKDAASSGEGEDDFEFTMRQDEILEIFFEDLELPNLVRTTLAEVESHKWRRAISITACSCANFATPKPCDSQKFSAANPTTAPCCAISTHSAS